MSVKTSHRRRSAKELRAIAFAIADEIETRAQSYLRKGYARKEAINLALADAGGF